MGAAWLMLWSFDAMHGVPRSLALAMIVFAVLLPEYAVDLHYAREGAGPDGMEHASLMLAAMTGAGRMLIGLAWPFVILLFWWRSRGNCLRLERDHSAELSLLFLAVLYGFTIYMRGYLSILDTPVLLLLFGLYLWSSPRREVTHPQTRKDDVSGSISDGSLRRISALCVFGYGAATTSLAAAPFADGLLLAGRHTDIDQFALVQWAVPLASKGPWLFLAAALIWRARTGRTVSALLTSQMGLWTLLVASLPLMTLLHGPVLGSYEVLILNDRQGSELVLTATQSLFALALLSGLVVSWRSALTLLGLFIAQEVLSAVHPEGNAAIIRGLFSVIYLGAAAAVVLGQRARVEVLAGVIPVMRTPINPATARTDHRFGKR